MKQSERRNTDGSLYEASQLELSKKGMFDYKKARLVIMWRNDLSKNEQIIILKDIYPILNDVPIKELIQEVRKNNEQWVFAEMGFGQAMDLVKQAQLRGLRIFVEEMEV